MSHNIYAGLACLSFIGVFLSYVIPIIGGIIGTVLICLSNGMILSVAGKAKCGKPTHVAVPDDDNWTWPYKVID